MHREDSWSIFLVVLGPFIVMVATTYLLFMLRGLLVGREWAYPLGIAVSSAAIGLFSILMPPSMSDWYWCGQGITTLALLYLLLTARPRDETQRTRRDAGLGWRVFWAGWTLVAAVAPAYLLRS